MYNPFRKSTEKPIKRDTSVEVRQSIINSLVAKMFPNGDPEFFKPSYTLDKKFEEQVKNPYGTNSWVYAASSAIATNLIQLPKVLDQANDDGDESDVITSNPILDLLNRPNPLMDGPTFWENIILDLMLPTSTTKGGQCFIVAENFSNDGVNLTKGEIPKELYPFSDQFFIPVLDKDDNSLLGWKYQPSGMEKAILYKPEEVIRIFLVDPLHPLKGQAPIWAARQSLRQDLKAAALNENFFDNNASLGGVLQTDAELNPEEAREIRDSFEEAYRGQSKAGRTAVLHTGLKYEMFQQTHQAMQFMDQKEWTREEILAVYGVPKFVVALYEDLNLATAEVAQKIFWTQTLLPLDDRILRAFNTQWVMFTNKGKFKLESDLSKVPALQPDLTAKLEQAKKLFELQVPLAEINRRLELQLDLENVPWAETHFVNFGLAPAEEVLNKLDEEPEEGEDEEGSANSENEVEETDENSDKTNAPKPEDLKLLKVLDAVEKASNKSAKEDIHRTMYVNKVLLPDEKKFKQVLSRFFIQQRNSIQDNIDDWARSQSNKSVTKEDGTPEFEKPKVKKLLGSKKEQDKKLQKTTKPEYIRQALSESKVVEAELDEILNWTLDSPSMKRVVGKRLQQIKSVNTTTFKSVGHHIGAAVEKAVKQQLGVKETAKMIKQAVGEVYSKKIKAETIARTEVSSIHSQTRMDIYKEENITHIKWLTAGDELVRSVDNGAEFPHDILDNEVSTIQDGFDNGEFIRFPLDPSASVSNIINCRCTFISVKGDKE